MFQGIFSGFLGFFIGKVSVDVLKMLSLNSTFQDLLYGKLYFSLAQMFIGFLICIYRGKMKKVYA